MRATKHRGLDTPPRGSDPPRPSLTTICLAVITGLCAPVVAKAQNAVIPTDAWPWNVTVVAGYLAGRPDISDHVAHYEQWFSTGQAGVVLGRHFTKQLKGEVELSASGEGRQWVQRLANIPGLPYPVPYSLDLYSSRREVSASLMWEFLDNQWVQPFLQIGAAVDVERQRARTFHQTTSVGPIRTPESIVTVVPDGEEITTATRGRLVFGGGAKMYVSPRVFIRTDGRFGSGSAGHHVAFRAGLGVDF